MSLLSLSAAEEGPARAAGKRRGNAPAILQSFGGGRNSILVHLACLARCGGCWIVVRASRPRPSAMMLARLGSSAPPMAATPSSPAPSRDDLRLLPGRGTYQDLAAPGADAAALADCLTALRNDNGSFGAGLRQTRSGW